MVQVRKIQCETCPFRRSPMALKRSATRMREIRKSQIEGHFHFCHTDGINALSSVDDDNDASYCRGAVTYLRRKFN